MITKAFGKTIQYPESKPYIEVDKQKKAKIVKYFNEAIASLKIARSEYYTAQYKNMSPHNESDNKFTFNEYTNGINSTGLF